MKLAGLKHRMLDISIIIPAHNEEKYIEKTLKAIKDSSYKKYEIIVICDFCSDSTYKIARKYTKNVYKVNFKNIPKNRNFGVEKAKGKILVFCDADTIISENYLSSIKKAINKGVEYGTAKWVSETGSKFGEYFAWGNNHGNKRDKTVAGNFFVKKEVFEEVRGFKNLRKGEDTDLGDRLRKKAKVYVFIEKAHYIPSERKFKSGFLKFWANSVYETWLYKLNKKRYERKFSYG